MSSPAQGGPPAPKEKIRSRVLTRMKTLVKKRLSGSNKTAAPVTPAEPVAAAAAPAQASPAAASGTAAAGASKSKKLEVAAADATKIPRIQLHEERARKLGERFGLEIKPSDWHTTEGEALRVNKPIRMRVHRSCHVCNTAFGASKECTSCKHTRCKKCPRYPPKRTEAEKIASRERRAAVLKEQKENAPIIPDWDATCQKKITLTIPAKHGGQDLVYKKSRQRVRRTCCQCSKLFMSGNKLCPGCEHRRCTDCPRDPAKKNKYPYGYPGDEFGAKSVPRYKCQACKSKFPVETPNGTPCAKCGHEKCAECPRIQPHRVEPEPDPEILKVIEARLSKLRVG